MNRVLVAGATGYLGQYIVKNLIERKYVTAALVRNIAKFELFGLGVEKVVHAEVTDKASLAHCCDGVDVVISSIGITRQTDGLTYTDVDFQANLNLLNEAKKSGVKKFIYVSVLNGDKLRSLQICEAKERFVDELKHSGLDYCIIRPNGFFSDMTELYTMAQKGRIFLFGDGNLRLNPIHGEDLAQLCVDSIHLDEKEIAVGGPETLSQVDCAKLAFAAAGKPLRITYIPDWVRRMVLKVLQTVMSESKYGPIEFFMQVMAMEMVAPEYGHHRLAEYFMSLNESRNGG